MVGQVVHFGRVFLEVVETVDPDGGVVNKFPSIFRDHALFFQIRAVDGVVALVGFLLEKRQDALEENIFWVLDLREFKGGGHSVLQIDWRVDFFAGFDTGTGDEEGNADAVDVHVLFADEAVVTHCKAVIGGEDDVGIVGFARFFQCLENTSDLRVHM